MENQSAYYMIITYPENFEKSCKEIDETGILPVPQDNVDLAYQHIFWKLKNPQEFIEKASEYKREKIMAIKSSDAELRTNGGRINYSKEYGIEQLIVGFLEKRDIFKVKGLEKFDLSKF
jgi:hypothetical protein